MKNQILFALLMGKSTTKEIIEFSKWETKYTEFCLAIADLESEKKVVCDEKGGYKLTDKGWRSFS